MCQMTLNGRAETAGVFCDNSKIFEQFNLRICVCVCLCECMCVPLWMYWCACIHSHCCWRLQYTLDSNHNYSSVPYNSLCVCVCVCACVKIDKINFKHENVLYNLSHINSFYVMTVYNVWGHGTDRLCGYISPYPVNKSIYMAEKGKEALFTCTQKHEHACLASKSVMQIQQQYSFSLLCVCVCV